LYVQGNVLPTIDTTANDYYDVGSLSQEWANVYAANIRAATNIYDAALHATYVTYSAGTSPNIGHQDCLRRLPRYRPMC